MSDPAWVTDVSRTQALSVQVIRTIEAYVQSLSGLKTEVSSWDMNLISSKDDDTTGMKITITVDFIEDKENENG